MDKERCEGQPTGAPVPDPRARARTLCWLFFKVSMLTLGGGYSMVPVVQRKLADRGLMSEADFHECLALAQSLPGPIIFNTAFLVGSRLAGHGGAFLAATAVVLPPFASILAAALLYDQVASSPWARGFVRACVGTAIGFVAALLVRIARSVRWRGVEVLLASLGTAALFVLPGVGPLVVLALAGAAYLGRRG